MTRRWLMLMRLAVTLTLLASVILLVDRPALGRHIAGADPLWLVAGAGLVPAQIALATQRWRMCAHLFGVPLTGAKAFWSYYAGFLVNQLMPGGVLGDVGRATAHGRATGRAGAAAAAAVLDRLWGPLSLVAVWALGWSARLAGPSGALGTGGAILLLLIATILVARRRVGSHATGTIAVMAGISLALVALFLVGLWSAARALGILMELAPLVTGGTALLLAMAIPISIAGWGVREAAGAVALGPMLGDPALAVSISVIYGAAVLLGSLPGAVGGLWLYWTAARSKTHSMSSPSGT